MKRHRILPVWLAPLGALALFVSLFFHLVQNQATIEAKRQELTQVQARISAQEAANQELARSLADGEDAIIERIAREQGYAKPNERIFVGY